MDTYFLTEEYRVGTVHKHTDSYLPTVIVGHGKHSLKEELAILDSTDWSALSEVRVKHFNTNKEYNAYIRNMKSLGVCIEYSKQ